MSCKRFRRCRTTLTLRLDRSGILLGRVMRADEKLHGWDGDGAARVFEVGESRYNGYATRGVGELGCGIFDSKR